MKPAISRSYEPVSMGRPASVAGGYHVDQAPALAVAEFHLALGKGEKRVVATTSHVVTRMEPGAPLADDDGARSHDSAVEDLDPEPLRI
jgi:hypothetical protein